ncbi:MAG: type II secretion system protein [Bacteriovoracaceae bacterium]
MMNQKYHNGFTLIEVLISMVLLSFVMLGVIGITNNSVNTKDKVLSEDKEKLQVEVALSVFEWDFTQIYSPLFFSERYKQEKGSNKSYSGDSPTFNDEDNAPFDNSFYEGNRRFAFPNQDGLPVPIYQAENNSFEFFSISNRRKVENSNQSEFTWVKYALENDDLTDEEKSKNVEKGKMKLVRYFVPFNVYDSGEIDYSKIQAQTLLRSVESLKFEFWNPKGKKFVERLNEVEQGEHLIRGVKITLHWKNLNGVDIKVEKVFRSVWPFDNNKSKKEKQRSSTAEDNLIENSDENKNTPNSDE